MVKIQGHSGFNSSQFGQFYVKIVFLMNYICSLVIILVNTLYASKIMLDYEKPTFFSFIFMGLSLARARGLIGRAIRRHFPLGSSAARSRYVTNLKGHLLGPVVHRSGCHVFMPKQSPVFSPRGRVEALIFPS